jgi:hypothetical protein
MNCYLETHLIGDPTFSFTPFDAKTDLNEWVTSEKGNISFWNKNRSSSYADVQALALRMLFQEKGPEISDLLLRTFRSSPWFTVRMEAFKLLRICKDRNFIEAINLGIGDSYELIQRMAAVYMSESGDSSHIPFMISALLRNNLSKRVTYDLSDAVGMFDKELLLAELDKQLGGAEFISDKPEPGNDVKKSLEYNCNRMKTYVDEVLDPGTTEKEKLFNIKTFRNQTVHPYVKELINYLDTTTNKKLKLTGVEMLGWFDHSYLRDKIRDFCRKELKEEGLSGEMKKELLKTINRIN